MGFVGDTLRRGEYILAPTPSSLPGNFIFLTLTTHLHETTLRSQGSFLRLLFIPSHVFTKDASGEENYCAALGVFTDIPFFVSSVPVLSS